MYKNVVGFKWEKRCQLMHNSGIRVSQANLQENIFFEICESSIEIS